MKKFLVNIILSCIVIFIIIILLNKTNSNENISQVEPTINENILNNSENNLKLDFTDKQKKLILLMINEDIDIFYKNENVDSLFQEIAKEHNIVKVTASKLFKDYHLNEIKADDQYKDKEIILTGSISSIDRSIGNNYLLSLSTNEMFYTVQAHFREEYKSVLAELKKGQNYTMHCIGNGMLIKSPMLKNCEPIQVWIDSEVDSLFLKLYKVIYSNKSFKEVIEYPKSIKVYIIISIFILTLNEDNSLLDISKYDKKSSKLFETEFNKMLNYLKEIKPQIEEKNLGIKDIIQIIKEK